MKKAWVENNRIRDIAAGNPADLFHPDIAKLYDTDVPDDAENGDGWVNGTLTKPVIPDPVPVEPPAPVPPKVSPVEFMLLFTAAERVAIKAARATNPVIDDFLDIIDDPRLTYVDLGLVSTQEAVGYLAMEGIIAEARIQAILSGVVQ
jgi:hypothetical protein